MKYRKTSADMTDGGAESVRGDKRVSDVLTRETLNESLRKQLAGWAHRSHDSVPFPYALTELRENNLSVWYGRVDCHEY